MKKSEFAELCWSTKARVVMADLRAMPRLVLGLYFWYGWVIGEWFMALGVAATTQQSAFVVIYAGVLPAVLGLYAGTGHKKQEM